jgi:hypothetical protein
LSQKRIVRTEPKPLSWKLRDDIDTILSKSPAVKVHTEPYEIRKIAENILKVLDEKYGVSLDYEDQWICNWRSDKIE